MRVGGDKKNNLISMQQWDQKHHAGEEIGNDRQWQEKSGHRQTISRWNSNGGRSGNAIDDPSRYDIDR